MVHPFRISSCFSKHASDSIGSIGLLRTPYFAKEKKLSVFFGAQERDTWRC